MPGKAGNHGLKTKYIPIGSYDVLDEPFLYTIVCANT